MVLGALLRDAREDRRPEPDLEAAEKAPATSGLVDVILPESRGLDLRRSNEESLVKRAFFSPLLKELAYHGASGTGRVEMTVPVTSIAPVPGESLMGVFNPETGEVVAKA